ncbi:MAG: flagellar biosynthesis protein FlhB [Deltaproteobacteria bacterium]|jgi:flagellar biosynthetic protein FlhB|nr:MAG: flagellar biosynthesis protein FlhB [Deltaproteobacteria bacterium]
MPEGHEKIEKATPRKRQKAREKGQAARSRELTSIAGTAGILLMFYFAGDSFLKNMMVETGKLLGLQYGQNPITVMKAASYKMLWTLMPFLGTAAIFAIIAGVLQGGIILKPLKFEIEKLNPLNGLKQLFSISGLVNFLKSFLKFVVGGFMFYYIIKKLIPILPFTAGMDIRGLQEISGRLISKAVLSALVIFFIIAIMDYLYERWRFERSIRMTKQEIKEEYKESEGEPLIKSRIKSLQREMARKRMMQEVPKATVVITNPTHIVVALRYKRDEMSAPEVIAKGSGFIAEKIKEIARKHHIPVVEDKLLARALYKLKINSYIPEELYRAVARILAYIYKLKAESSKLSPLSFISRGQV